jgi:predicted dinucleotide-binding enzyme
MNIQKMKIGILGSGVVGQTLASGFLAKGHEVMIGTLEPDKLTEWLAKNTKAKVGNFEETATFGELIVLAVKGSVIESAIERAKADNLDAKIVIDVTNPLVFEKEGQSPHLSVGFPHSNGEKVQELLPKAKVVKAFNIVGSIHFTNAKLQEGTADMIIAGNDSEAKKTVVEIASGWGWSVTDMGDITQAYLLESLAMLWIRYAFLNNHWTHAFKILKK